MADQQLGYDPTSADSIVEYAERLVGHTLREVTGLVSIEDTRKRRGAFGNALEEFYFKIPPNSRSEADFAEAGLELKSTPLKTTKKGQLVAKERLVISMINYETVVGEDFEHSHLMEKARDILLISYLYERDKSPLDYVVEAVVHWGFPEEDLPQIRLDWETVVGKVRSGHAEEISGGDTMYLEACTKGKDGSVRTSQPFSDVPAKPRAWALKASYMTAVQRRIIDGLVSIPRREDECDLGLLALVRKRFEPYFGMTEEELGARLGVNTKAKGGCAAMTKRILGVGTESEIAEFAKAGIAPKTLHLRRGGGPKESVSFPKFDYFELAETDFDKSEFRRQLGRKYLFVLYRDDAEGTCRLSDVCFWQMPEADLPEARRCYDQMRENVLQGRADISVKMSENRCCHVRPHGRRKTDVAAQPHGDPVVKKCFWLNASYLKDEIARVLSAG